MMESSNGESSDDDDDDNDDDDGDKKKKKKGKKPVKPKKKRKNGSDDEPLEDSDDGDGEGRELDYISSSDEDRYIDSVPTSSALNIDYIALCDLVMLILMRKTDLRVLLKKMHFVSCLTQTKKTKMKKKKRTKIRIRRMKMLKVVKTSQVISPKTTRMTRKRKKTKRKARTRNLAKRNMVGNENNIYYVIKLTSVPSLGSSSDSGGESSGSELEKAKPSPKMKS